MFLETSIDQDDVAQDLNLLLKITDDHTVLVVKVVQVRRVDRHRLMFHLDTYQMDIIHLQVTKSYTFNFILLWQPYCNVLSFKAWLFYSVPSQN